MNSQKIAVSTDCVVISKTGNTEKVLLIKRKKEPFKGQWALPGGFLEDQEDLKEGAKRELKEETGVDIEEVQQIAAFGAPNRDPRGRTISIAFWGTLPSELKAEARDDAADARWFQVDHLPDLAFDHALILSAGIDLYRAKKS